MGSTVLQRTITPRTIVYSGMIAAVYAVVTISLAPISFGPLQLRLATMLIPLCLVSPVYGLGLAVGIGIANLTSPFGLYDIALMPLVSFVVMQIAYHYRHYPWLVLPVMAGVMAMAIAYFPLWLGGGIPWWPTVIYIFVSLLTLYIVGYIVWRKTLLWETTP